MLEDFLFDGEWYCVNLKSEREWDLFWGEVKNRVGDIPEKLIAEKNWHFGTCGKGLTYCISYDTRCFESVRWDWGSMSFYEDFGYIVYTFDEVWRGICGLEECPGLVCDHEISIDDLFGGAIC